MMHKWTKVKEEGVIRLESYIENERCDLKPINPYMHKMGPRGSNYYIFGDHFDPKIVRKAQVTCIPPS